MHRGAVSAKIKNGLETAAAERGREKPLKIASICIDYRSRVSGAQLHAHTLRGLAVNTITHCRVGQSERGGYD